jgi:hypothetical protein
MWEAVSVQRSFRRILVASTIDHKKKGVLKALQMPPQGQIHSPQEADVHTGVFHRWHVRGDEIERE